MHKATAMITVLGTLLGVATHAIAIPDPSTTSSSAVTITPMDTGNLRIAEQMSPDRLVLEFTTPTHNWFAGMFAHLPTDRPMTLGFSMKDNNTKGNEGNVKKWQGLKPVFTYADPLQYNTYEWFQKDEKGRWVSGDPFKQGDARYAGNGPTPTQTAIPPSLASQFLANNGAYWSAWREVDKVEVVSNLNIFRITQRFAAPTATMAMRVPCPYPVLETMLTRLKDARVPGVTVDEIGKTAEGRALQAIRLNALSPETPAEQCKTVVVIAGEHATEYAASWTLLGILTHLLQEDPQHPVLRKDINWLLVPIEDPDGNVHATFDRLTEHWYGANDPNTPTEVYAYARYFRDYVYAGHTIDLVISLHNVEATECANIYCPFVDKRHVPEVTAFTRNVYERAQQHGFQTDATDTPWDYGFQAFRLYGWIALEYSSLDLAFEVNDRYPAQRLSLQEIQQLGALLSDECADWAASSAGQQWHTRALKLTSLKTTEREVYFQKRKYHPEQENPFDLLWYGY